MNETAKIHENPPNEPPALAKTVVLVGLMGAGKSCIGRRLAQRLNVSFVDADAEIEQAAGCTISEIFEKYGEAAFRDGERRVMSRLLLGPPTILASGGGAHTIASPHGCRNENPRTSSSAGGASGNIGS